MLTKEEQEEQAKKENPEGTPDDPNKVEDPNKENPEDAYSDDAPVKVKIDGKLVEMTAKELSEGYMRQADYTRKTQELKNATPQEKKEVEKEAQKIIDNPESFTPEDINTAKYLLKVIKGTGIAKDFGLMTKEDYEAERQREKQVAEFGNKIESDKAEIAKMKGMPAVNEDEIIDHMQETGIRNFKAAYLNKYDAQYRDYIIKQAKGDSSYQTDKGGKKIEPVDKVVNVRTEEGHRSFLADEIQKLKN